MEEDFAVVIPGGHITWIVKITEFVTLEFDLEVSRFLRSTSKWIVLSRRDVHLTYDCAIRADPTPVNGVALQPVIQRVVHSREIRKSRPSFGILAFRRERARVVNQHQVTAPRYISSEGSNEQITCLLMDHVGKNHPCARGLPEERFREVRVAHRDDV